MGVKLAFGTIHTPRRTPTPDFMKQSQSSLASTLGSTGSQGSRGSERYVKIALAQS